MTTHFSGRSSQHVAHEADAQRSAVAVSKGARPAAAAAHKPSVAAVSAASGSPLPGTLRSEMEALFGQDFSTVRVASGRDAERASRGLGARAFAVGEQLSFAPGTYAPGTTAGRALVAHELTHVIQQRASGRAEIACDGDTSLAGRIQALREALNSAKDAAARKPLVAQAVALGDELAAGLAAARKAEPPDGGDPAWEIRESFKRIGATLHGVGEGGAVVQMAAKTPDAQVQSTAVQGLRSRSGVEGQQKLFAQVAPLAGESIAAPATGQDSKQWLKANTGKIGKTLSTLDQRGLKGIRRESLGLEMSEGLMQEYYGKSDVDEKPDPMGDPTAATLKIDTQTKQIKADCDVYATFGARLLREQGWATVGYLVILPNEQKEGKDRDAHAVALASKAADPADASKGLAYAGISNTVIRELGGHGKALATEADAQALLLALAHEVYDSKPLTNYDVYYLGAGAGGRYDVRLADPKNNALTPIKSVRP